MTHQLRPRRGLTLFEVLIALALMMALIATLFTFMQNLVRSRDVAFEHSARQLAAATLIDRVEADLMTCLVGDSVHGAGVSGDETSIRILSRAVPVNLAERGRYDPTILSDLQLSQYRFNAGSRTIEAQKNVAGAGGSSFSSLGGEVAKVRFRFHDGTNWRDSFDSLAENRLPIAIEVAVWYQPWPGEDEADEEQELEDEDPDRLTFDADVDPFDEYGFVEFEDRGFDVPTPDRIRVIAIPDAATQDAGEEGGMQ